MRRLIVNADDYGLTPSVSAGIREAHRCGLVTSTTAMLNLPGVEAELTAAQAECPALGLGVHLVLSKGRPCLPPAHLPRLMSLGDGAEFPSQRQLRAGLDVLDLAEVESEWSAQIDRFVAAAGRAPTHLDSHHHAAYLSPGLFAVLLRLARRHGCAIRLPLSAHDRAQRHLGLPPGRLPDFRAALAASPVPHPDHLDARFYGPSATEATLLDLTTTLSPGTTELMTHPALSDPALASETTYAAERAQELAALTSPQVRDAVAAAGVELISFRLLSETHV